METPEIEIKKTTIRWVSYMLSENQLKQFDGNAISFINIGTAVVTINDQMVLSNGQSLSLNCDQNEIDKTLYKINFNVIGIPSLIVWVKENMNFNKELVNYGILKRPSRIAQLQQISDIKNLNRRRILLRTFDKTRKGKDF